MRIAIDFRTKKNFSPCVNAFLEQLWLGMAGYEPAYKYLFLINDNAVLEEGLPENISVQNIKKNSLTWLKQKKILQVLNEYRADKYITLQEDGFCITTPVNKVFEKKNFQQPAAKVFFSGYTKNHWSLSHSSINNSAVIKPAFQAMTDPLSWAEAESIKTQYTGGRDFFLFTGDIDEQHRLIELLKAFSLFKKKQQSNMQLVIAGYPVLWTGVFEEKLSTYLYRQDVVLLKNLPPEEIIKLTAAAYAQLCPATENKLPLALIQAIQMGVAIIASEIPALRQTTDAAIWVDNNHLQDDFAKAMMLLYKDESRKHLLVQKAKEEAKEFQWEQMLGEVLHTLKQ